MDIVCGKHLQSTNGNRWQATQAIEWNKQHALVQQALLAHLSPSELMKVY